MDEVTADSLERAKEIIKLIRQTAFFAEFTFEELKKLLKHARPRYFHAKAAIIEREDKSTSFYVLLKGKVKLDFLREGAANVSSIVEEESFFGEIALTAHSAPPALCTAVTDITALEIKSTLLHEHTPITSKIQVQLLNILTQRLQKVIAATINLPSSSERELVFAEALAVAENSPSVYAPETPILETALGAHAALKQEENAEQRQPKSLAQLKAAQVAPVQAAVPPPAENVPQAKPKIAKRDLTTSTVKEKPVFIPNPFATPTARAAEIDLSIDKNEGMETLIRKIQLRTEFFGSRFSTEICDFIVNKLYSYWTGAKLAKINPHKIWDAGSFGSGSTHLLRALHLIVICPEGEALFSAAYLGLPFSHRVIGSAKFGCTGTFLGSNEAIERFFAGEILQRAVVGDLEIPIDRLWHGKECIEFLTHTTADVRPETLFLIFDGVDGQNTRKVREKFPEHQLLTAVKGTSFNPEDLGTIFTQPEAELTEFKLIVPKQDYRDEGFYAGQTVFLPDFTQLYGDLKEMAYAANVFGTIFGIAHIGPDYSGSLWGSKGGAEGALKATRAMYGIAGAQSAAEIAAAINWADNK